MTYHLYWSNPDWICRYNILCGWSIKHAFWCFWFCCNINEFWYSLMLRKTWMQSSQMQTRTVRIHSLICAHVHITLEGRMTYVAYTPMVDWKWAQLNCVYLAITFCVYELSCVCACARVWVWIMGEEWQEIQEEFHFTNTIRWSHLETKPSLQHLAFYQPNII